MKKGFTLAEVLITLGIIGIVAAMTMPNLIQKINEKRTVSKLIAVHSILSRAIRLAEEEYGTVDGWGLKGYGSAEEGKIIANYIKPYLKMAIDCGYDQKIRCIPPGKYRALNGEMYDSYTNTQADYAIKLMNGQSVWWRSAKTDWLETESYIIFLVDVNGNNHQKNIIGKDLFGFEYYVNGGFKPTGSPGTKYANTCNLNSNGRGCAYHVIHYKNMDYLHKK